MRKTMWKVPILAVYHWGTIPYRHWKLRSLMGANQAPIVVLFYHRVADRDPVPWSIGNSQFARQMEWLRARFEMISLEEVQRRMREGNPRPAAHVTFDDGYGENCDFAIPFLVKREIPCTYFVTLDHVVHHTPFAHDLKLGKRFPVNTVKQLQQMSRDGIEIGAHTRTHPDLGSLKDERALRDEISVAGTELEQQVGQRIRYFAFPFGLKRNIPRAGYRIAVEHGYEGIVSAYGGYNFPGENAFHIQRVHGDPEMTRFKNAVSLDPRKLWLPRLDEEWDSQSESGNDWAPPADGDTMSEPDAIGASPVLVPSHSDG